VDKTHTSATFARHNARILLCGLGGPAKAALAFRVGTVKLNDTDCFLELLLIQLLGRLPHDLASEIFDSELDSTELDHVELSDFVVLCMDQII
jgi:hypothetical protein